MVSRTRKKSGDSAGVWKDTFPRLLNSCLLICCVFNFIALGYGVKSSSPKEIHHVESVVTNHFFVVTQYVSSVSSSAGKLADPLSDIVGKEIPVTYHFMIVDNRPMFKFYGHCYGEGDATSYGRIKKIFPDRVLLDGPVYLRNSSNPDETRSPPIVKEL